MSELAKQIYDDFKISDEFKSGINDKISKWLSEHDGEPYGNEVEGRSKIVWKLIKKQSKVLSANLVKPFITGDKICKIYPKTKFDTIKANIDEKLLNYFWNKEFERIKFINTTSNIVTKEGTAIARVFWEKQKTQNKQEISYNQYVQLQTVGSKFKTIEKDGKYYIVIENVTKNRPNAEILPNEDVFTDPLASSIQSSRYIIVRYNTTKDELLSDEKYDKRKVEKFFNNNSTSTEVADNIHDTRNIEYLDTEDKSKEDSEFYVYEYWYKEKGKIKIVYFLPYSSSDIEIIGKDTFDFDFFPFREVNLFENEFNIWGDSLAEMISDEQKFITSIIRGVVDNMSMSNNGTKFIRKGSLDSVNMKRLLEGKPFVEIDSIGLPINQVIYDGKFNEVPSVVYNMLQIVENQAEGLTGVNRTISGMSGKELNSPASNFSMMMSQAQVRLLVFNIQLQEYIKDILVMWLKMAMKYLSDEEIEKITGINIPEVKAKEQAKLEDKYRVQELPEDIQAQARLLIFKEINDMFNKSDVDYDIKIVVGTDGLKESRINQINMLMQQASQLVQVGACPPEIVQKLLAKLFELMEFPSIADEIENYKHQVDPIQQQAKQIELIKQQAEAKEKEAKSIKEQALAQNALARTKMTEVKAQKEVLSTDADIAKKYAELLEKLEKHGITLDELNKGDLNG